MTHSPESSDDFYCAAIGILQSNEIPFLVGGAYALRQYTGVVRDTKDFDVFMMQSDLERALGVFKAAGYRADVAFAHWLAKVHYGEAFIDIIYRAGNGLCAVDESWFRDQTMITMFGKEVGLVRPEDMIWQKGYIQERERFDGADIAHLLRGCAEEIDWEYLVRRFGPDWRVLLGHLIFFGFIYPAERGHIPEAIMRELLGRLSPELAGADRADGDRKVCQGTLISRAQYLPDIERWGYTDARQNGRSEMTAEDIESWTNAIGKERAWA